MKKIFLLVITVAFTVICFAQEQDAAILTQHTPESKAFYLQKYKTNKIVGYSLLGVAAGSLIAYAIIQSNESKSGLGLETLKGIELPILAIASAGISIPLFVAAHKNKNKAMQFGVQNQTGYHLEGDKIGANSMLALSLKIEL